MNIDYALKLADACRQSGDLPRAKQVLLQLLQSQPGHATALFTLGQICADASEWEEAESWLKKATEISPGDAVLHKHLADAQAEQGKTELAKAAYEKAIALDPDYFNPHANLANLLLTQGDADGAIEHYQAAIKLRPDIAELHDSIGRAFEAANLAHLARAAFLQALKLKPELATAHYNLASLLDREGHLTSACHHYRQAVSIAPQLTAAQTGLTETLIKLGETTEASQLLERLDAQPEIFPSEPRTILRILLASAEKRYGDALLLLKRLEDTAPSQKRWVHLQQAYIHDKSGDPALAFTALQKAHALSHHQFNRDEVCRFIDQLIELYSPDAMKRLPKATHTLPQPLFIIGMPRAGKSLTEKLLTLDSRCYGLDEQHSVQHVFTQFASQKPGLSLLEVESALTSEDLNRLAADYLDIAEEYLNDAGKSLQDGVTHLISATPSNLSTAPLIRRLFPQAPIIHVRRHPLDTCLACYFKSFGNPVYAWTEDLQEIGHFYLLYQRLIGHWRDMLDISMLEIDYEDLVADPMTTRARLQAYVGLSDSANQTSDDGRVVSLDLSSDHIGDWQRYREQLQPLMKVLSGIDPVNVITDGAIAAS